MNIKVFLIKHLIRKKIHENYSIISNDCWGGEFYQFHNLPYMSPFVGLMIMAPDYIKLLSNLEYYLKQKIEFVKYSSYKKINELLENEHFPLGLLGEVEICFLHYKSEQEVIEK